MQPCFPSDAHSTAAAAADTDCVDILTAMTMCMHTGRSSVCSLMKLRGGAIF